MQLDLNGRHCAAQQNVCQLRASGAFLFLSACRVLLVPPPCWILSVVRQKSRPPRYSKPGTIRLLMLSRSQFFCTCFAKNGCWIINRCCLVCMWQRMTTPVRNNNLYVFGKSSPNNRTLEHVKALFYLGQTQNAQKLKPISINTFLLPYFYFKYYYLNTCHFIKFFFFL